MKHLSVEGFTPLSQHELSAVEGGGFLTNLSARLTAELIPVVNVVKDVSAATAEFLKTLVGIIV